MVKQIWNLSVLECRSDDVDTFNILVNISYLFYFKSNDYEMI